MINFTSHGNEEAIELSACSALSVDSEGKETKSVVNLYLFVSMNLILCITSMLGNILILVALRKESSLHPPSKLLFRCLSCADLLVGIISEPVFVIYLITIANKNGDVCRIIEKISFILSHVLCDESIAILTSISVDRLLALLLRLSYRPKRLP